MAFIYIVVFVSSIQILLTECANFDTRQNALAHALRNILSPANTEKAIRIVDMAANGQIGKPISCIEEKLPRRVPIGRVSPTGLPPIGVASIDAAPVGVIRRPIQPVSGPGHPYFLTRGSVDVPIDLHNLMEHMSANTIQKHNSNVPKFAMPNIPIVINTSPDILQVPAVNEVNCLCAPQTPLVNPFLPAASPISAWAPPTSSLLPPALPTQSRGQFLRKIPIPPPTL